MSVSLPSNEAELEAFEGMLVSIKSPVVTDNYNADSYGEIIVAAERQWQYTQVHYSIENQSTIGGRCRKFVRVLRRKNTKKASPGDTFDQPPFVK